MALCETIVLAGGFLMTNNDLYSANDLDLFETHRKSRATAYIALFLSGALGGHRHYLGYGATGFIQTLFGLTIITACFKVWPFIQQANAFPDAEVIADNQTALWFLAGAASLVFLGLWLLVDLIRIPALTARKNNKLISRLASSPSAQACPTDTIAKFAALRANGTISEEEFIACKQQIIGMPAASATRPSGKSVAP